MADAPRLKAYLEYAERRPVLHMKRDAWDELDVTSTTTCLIDVGQTPMARTAHEASVVAAYGRRFSSATAEVGIVRLDPDDKPDIYNTDKYLVWVDLPSHSSFSQMVSAASTEDNENLREFLRENVFFVKQDPDDEHRRSDLPPTVRVLLDPPPRG